MFSRLKKHTRSERRGIFHSIFNNKESKLNDNEEQRNRQEKNTFGKKLKRSLSHLKLPGRSNRITNTLKEESNPSSYGLHFQTPEINRDDLNCTSLSSILKTSKNTKSFVKKNIRFEDSVNKFNTEEVKNVFTETKNETVDSDLAYYKKLKEELIERNKDIIKKSPLKRKSSELNFNIDVENQEKLLKIDENLFYYPPIDRCLEREDDDAFRSISKQYGICTYTWTCRMNSDTQLSFMDDSESTNTEISSVNNNMNRVEMLNVCDEQFSVECDKFLEGEPKNSVLIGKIATVKKNNQLRYNPIAKIEPCAVASLSKNREDTGRMSWCSA